MTTPEKLVTIGWFCFFGLAISVLALEKWVFIK